MQVSVEIGDPVDIHIHFCDRAKIDERFPGLEWNHAGNPPGDFDYAEMKIGGITIKFFT